MSTRTTMIQSLIGAISEEVLASIFQKLPTSINVDVPTKFDFYVSIFYKGELLRSRTLNYKREVAKNDTIESKHREFYRSHGSANERHPVYFYTRKGSRGRHVAMLRVGDFVIIASDENKIAVHLCCTVIMTMFLLLKSAALMKEWGCFLDLKEYFAAHPESCGESLAYLQNIEKVMVRELGGKHK